ncbi:lytic transglycosylase domain-containing protein [Pyxidicoccus sp. MSG2]|uniref:lytic transglycosylase domain-containing protein n=1 Tax=Pyxidicoccus sp. MSG2 TaxID=2996790 RepID=UPI00226E03F0|nr:lytic transglycosylase domain-containing protein [Pyxidicoccus sp. MSG2]MCY1019919.1 lytic transglycosylase domain-containing protein [Pyxidicoccus sp. MSG2]
MASKRARSGGGGFGIPGWAWLVPCALVPVVLLNVGISWLGGTTVSPLSFSFLEAKAGALRAYAEHRPSCLLEGHAELEPLIDAAERRHRLPPGLLRALVQVESETRVHRISPAGAMGPGQLMPTTASMLGVEDPFDPAPAIDASARYLAEQLRRFGDVRLAVAAYNAGPGAVNGRVPRNGETEYYVPKVLAAWKHTRPATPAVAARTVPKAPAPVTARVSARPAVKPAPVTRQAAQTATKPAPTAKPAPAVRPVARAKPAAKAPASADVQAKPGVTASARRG